MTNEPKIPLETYLQETLYLLRRSLELYQQGQPLFYRVMAVELRMLLCDTVRRHDRVVELSLIPRLRPDIALAPLAGERFEAGQPGLPLAEWLEQEARLGESDTITLREMIRRVCDQDGGAHVDRRQTYPRLDQPGAWMARMAEVVLAAFP